MPDRPAHDVDLALDALTHTERQAIAYAAAERRDLTLADGAPRLAALWHALAVAAAEANDREAAAFREWSEQLGPWAP